MSARLVEVVRTPLVEAIHRGDAAIVDADGRLLASVGDPHGKVTYWRSAAKPFQAMPLVYGGGPARWGLGREHVAIVTASHSGEPFHTRLVAELLDRIGATPSDLACGTHPPLRPEAAAALEREGKHPTVLHHNCSGKHAGMVALADVLDVERRGYERPAHPVQAEILTNIARFAGLAVTDVAVGVDGCGVPCFGTSVYHAALAFARLADPRGIEEPHAEAARVVRAAMAAHPELVAGTERLDTDLMTVARGRLVAKGGAAGVLGVGLADGTGVAVKIEDGATGPTPGRPTGVAMIEILRRLGALDADDAAALGEHARPSLATSRGLEVGFARPAFELDQAGPAADARA